MLLAHLLSYSLLVSCHFGTTLAVALFL